MVVFLYLDYTYGALGKGCTGDKHTFHHTIEVDMEKFILFTISLFLYNNGMMVLLF